ncbi:hypothetical protein [Legionella worsleiensis]|uniref:Uncharacterized protein n=1 Tax=Legionella worsleiensis TaxID=45076 RepID=A0A0W1A9L4_9GAMM|nr:hypothetical protein [Legionella worsleiensis]KTD77856.1 hypothetical protein Lwor_1738 [Legionella worsleiensis]STY33098.1 Uncharacterised protein [Legionella worsleiensis]
MNYPPYDNLPHEEKDSLMIDFKQSYTDFDNQMVAFSALQVLEANGVKNVHVIKVAPQSRGVYFDLSEQLAELIPTIPADKRYVIFSLPVNKGHHSVAVVMDTSNKQCFFIDSLYRYNGEAYHLIKRAVDNKILADYTIIAPAVTTIQQNDGTEEWSCGIHSAANMVGIILGTINLRTGAGITERTPDEVNHLTALFYRAYLDRMNLNNVALLEMMQIKTLRYALNELNQSSLSTNIKNDSLILSQFLCEMYPPSLTEDEYLLKQNIHSFLTEFTERSKENKVASLLITEAFKKNLPDDLEIRYNESVPRLYSYLVEQLALSTLTLRQQHTPSSSASSCTSVRPTTSPRTTVEHRIDAASSGASSSGASSSASSSEPVPSVMEFHRCAQQQMEFLAKQGFKMAAMSEADKPVMLSWRSESTSVASSQVTVTDQRTAFLYTNALSAIPQEHYLLKYAVAAKITLDHLNPDEIAAQFTKTDMLYQNLDYLQQKSLGTYLISSSESIPNDFAFRLMALYIVANDRLFDAALLRRAN